MRDLRYRESRGLGGMPSLRVAEVLRLHHEAAAGTKGEAVSDIPTCAETGEDVDDCHCVDVRDYDARDAADEREQQALDERGED
jgi:hypothetical protein